MEEACYEEEGGIKNADSDINDSDYDFSEGDDKSGADEDDRDYQKNVENDLLSSFKPRIFTMGTVEMETTQGEIAQSTSKM
jgi:hypothetical protein